MQGEKNESIDNKEIYKVIKLLNLYNSLRRQFLRGFFYGIGVFFGTTLGVALVLGVFYWFVPKLKVIPIIGGFATDIVEFVQTNLDEQGSTTPIRNSPIGK